MVQMSIFQPTVRTDCIAIPNRSRHASIKEGVHPTNSSSTLQHSQNCSFWALQNVMPMSHPNLIKFLTTVPSLQTRQESVLSRFHFPPSILHQNGWISQQHASFLWRSITPKFLHCLTSPPLPDDKFGAPDASVFTFQNVGPQPCTFFHPKARQTANSFRSTNAAAALFVEHHLNDARLPFEHRFSSRIRAASPGAKTHSASNVTNSAGTLHPWGATGITLNQHLLSQKISQGADPTNLGCWMSACFQGRQRATFTLFSACGPCFSPDWSGSVWSQHFQHLPAP